MKNIQSYLMLVLLTFPILLFANNNRKEIGDYYILSDTQDATVPAGKCKVTGTVFSDGIAVSNVRIFGYTTPTPVTTNADGYFEIMVDTSENGLYTNHNDYRPSYLDRYKFKSGHHLSLNFYIKYPQQMDYPVNVKKPVIYAYSEQTINFSIQIETEADITFTYPILKEEWKMTTTTDGMIQDDNLQSYPYLFWEGAMKNLTFQKNLGVVEGNMVAKTNYTSFLEEKLDQLGFSAKEKADFITFWTPDMMKYENIFVQLLVDDAYNTISTMKITPQPDQIRRVYLLFCDAEKIDNHFIESVTNFSGFDRQGFTIVEWGGTELEMKKDL